MSKAFTVFVLEDNEWYNKLLVHNLSLNPDFEVKSYFDSDSFFKALPERPNVVTLDYRLPETDGSSVLEKIKSFDPNIEVVVISEQDNIEVAVELLKLGAYDYLVKEKDIRDKLLNTINHIRSNVNLRKKVSRLQEEVEQKFDLGNTIIGESPALKKALAMVEKSLTTDITVSITGETGTGKEVVAKAIHYNSPRKENSFVAVNVAALPSELIESELFGHEKGAFTGAAFKRIGKFEEADGGTLFLDEIGEMDVTFQAKLLRALQEKEITRIGSNQTVKVDARIIVATNKNLKEEVKKGNFREDLYYRLFGLPIELPPLRERGKDILLLAKFFIEQFCQTQGLAVKKLSGEAQKKLLSYAFPGNIRELKSVVELAIVMADSEEIQSSDVLLSTDSVLPEIMTEEMTMKAYNFRILQLYLEKYDADIPTVAEKLDISQSTIYRMLKQQEG